METVLKTVVPRKRYRGFESHPFRHKLTRRRGMDLFGDICLVIIVLQLGWIRMRLDKVNDTLGNKKVSSKE
jgi:hypothetical protein